MRHEGGTREPGVVDTVLDDVDASGVAAQVHHVVPDGARDCQHPCCSAHDVAPTDRSSRLAVRAIQGMPVSGPTCAVSTNGIPCRREARAKASDEL